MPGKSTGPGPAAYLLPGETGYDAHDPSRYRNPQFSFGLKTTLTSKAKSPGPEYSIQEYTKYGPPHKPAWSFGLKPERAYRATAPGPGAHRPEVCPNFKTSRPPIYSFGIKPDRRAAFKVPAPNAYNLGSALEGYKYSMAKRLDLMGKGKSPGPAAYSLSRPETFQYKYSMGGRYTVSSRDKRPGPAEYGPDLYMPGDDSFKFSFGIRHGDWTKPMFVEADNVDCKPNFNK